MMRTLLLAASVAALLAWPGAAGAAERAFGWVTHFDESGNLMLHGDSNIYVVPDTIDTEDVAEGRVAHLSYDLINGQLIVSELEITGTGAGDSDS
ncbi:MAG: hypothetical protein IT535_13090 [Bauldia sp.]|nr:hypothetical protein [Bauldia sp.]